MAAAFSHWRVRSIAFAASATCIAALCALLWLASRTTLIESFTDAGVEVMLAPRPPPREPQRRVADQRPVAAPSAATPAAPSVDAQMLSRMLRCFNRLNPERARDCPREPPPPEWSSRDRLRIGGDFAGEEPLDLNDAFTVAEQRTLVMPPPCAGASPSGGVGAGVCVPFGIQPAPPSRSAEEVCEAGGLGPCHPPPFRPEDVRRER